MNGLCFSRVMRLSAMAFLVFSLVGCAGSRSSTYYLLSLASAGNDAAKSTEQGGCIHLRIARVTIPEYLNRPDIVTRTTENILTLSDDDQWAEPLSDIVARVLAEDISRHVCTKKYRCLPAGHPENPTIAWKWKSTGWMEASGKMPSSMRGGQSLEEPGIYFVSRKGQSSRNP